MPRIRRSEADQQIVDQHGQDFLEVLARGLRILGLFNAERRQLTLSELSEIAELPRATVRRVLYTLERLGFVELEGRQFRLAPRVLTLSSAYLTSNPVPAVMQPVVARISRELQEACSAAVLDGHDAVMVARSSPVRIITVGLELGFRLPAFCSAVGRVLLAGLPDTDLHDCLASLEPVAFTPHTLLDKGAIRDRILAARADGFATVEQEIELGFSSIAVAVQRHDRATTCALHVGLPAQRATRKRMIDEFLPVLQRAAEEATSLML
jgi:IclR family pca regulon transcriptional regulator